MCSTGPAPDSRFTGGSSRMSCASGTESSLEKAKVCVWWKRSKAYLLKLEVSIANQLKTAVSVDCVDLICS